MIGGLEWNESFELGVAQLDEQHRQLLGLAAAIDHALRGDGSLSDLRAAIGLLRDAFTAHFLDEERMMGRAGAMIHTISLDAHRAAHDGLLRDLETFSLASGDRLAGWIDLDVCASLVAEIAHHDGHLVTALAHSGHLRAATVDL